MKLLSAKSIACNLLIIGCSLPIFGAGCPSRRLSEEALQNRLNALPPAFAETISSSHAVFLMFGEESPYTNKEFWVESQAQKNNQNDLKRTVGPELVAQLSTAVSKLSFEQVHDRIENEKNTLPIDSLTRRLQTLVDHSPALFDMSNNLTKELLDRARADADPSAMD